MQKETRLKREIAKILKNPPTGITCYVKEESFDILEADIIGPPESPFENGVFKIEVKFPAKYPFEPPSLKFLTKIYHPNIDSKGRICLDLLKMPPAGNWSPAIGIEGLLVALRTLMSYPNTEDPLMPEIADEFKTVRVIYEKKAKEYTNKYAI